MEQEMELPPVPASFYSLDVNCLLNIFKRLEHDDLKNLGETCVLFKGVVNRIRERHYSIRLDLPTVKKGEKYINRVLIRTGPYVSWLLISSRSWIRSELVELTKLQIHKLLRIGKLSKSWLSNYNFHDAELLRLQCCDFPFEKCFFEEFKNLKHFYILSTKIGHDNLRMVCGKNPGIESFVYSNDEDFDCQLFELMPKVKTVAIRASGKYDTSKCISNLNSLLVLNQLTKLRLDCKMNLNDFLNNLALKGVLKELELHLVIFDDKTMKILNKFDKLQLLRIHTGMSGNVLKSSEALLLPPKLKHLYLYEFSFTHESYFATIRSLKHLQSLDISLLEVEFYFSDVTKLFRETLKVLEDNGENHRLDVVLPWYCDFKFWPNPSGNYLPRIESDRLRFIHGDETNYNELGIGILSPGLNKHALYCFCMDWEDYGGGGHVESMAL